MSATFPDQYARYRQRGAAADPGTPALASRSKQAPGVTPRESGSPSLCTCAPGLRDLPSRRRRWPVSSLRCSAPRVNPRARTADATGTKPLPAGADSPSRQLIKASRNPCKRQWRSDMGVEPTQDESIAPQTVLKTAAVTGPRAAPLRILPRERARAPGRSTRRAGAGGRLPAVYSSSAARRRQRTASHATTTTASKTTAATTAITSPPVPPASAVAAAAFGFRSR